MKHKIQMSEIFKKVIETEGITDNDKYYWGYQYRLSKEVIVPYLQNAGVFKSGMNIIEIGAAEGGVLVPFVEAGAAQAFGTDIYSWRLDIGKDISKITGLNIDFFKHDIISDKIPKNILGKMDLVILRDVIEHLEDPDTALQNIHKLLKPGGFLFVTFPPYHSPYGGHQHTIANKLGMVPYIHLLPENIFELFLKGGRKNDIEEVKRLRTIKLTPVKFKKASFNTGFTIYREEYYLLRPVFKMKFGLPSLKLPKYITPGIFKKYFSLEALYILKKS